MGRRIRQMLKDPLCRACAAGALTTIIAVTAVAPAFHPGENGLCSLEATDPADKRPSAACPALRPDLADEHQEDHSLPPGQQEKMGITAISTGALSARSSIAMFGRAQIALDHPPVNRLPLITASA
jgi:hypothetical protein